MLADRVSWRRAFGAWRLASTADDGWRRQTRRWWWWRWRRGNYKGQRGRDCKPRQRCATKVEENYVGVKVSQEEKKTGSRFQLTFQRDGCHPLASRGVEGTWLVPGRAARVSEDARETATETGRPSCTTPVPRPSFLDERYLRFQQPPDRRPPGLLVGCPPAPPARLLASSAHSSTRWTLAASINIGTWPLHQRLWARSALHPAPVRTCARLEL